MHRKPAAIYIVRLFTQEVKKLRVAHGQQEVECVIRVGHDHEQRRLAITQGIQLQLIIGRQVAQLLYVEGRKTRTAGDEDAFCRLA